MEHHELVAGAFGAQAAAYLTSAAHAAGADLQALADAFSGAPGARVLDLGCGAGHASYAVAPAVREVVAYDIAQPMLDTVAATAAARGLTNVRVAQGPAERLPFDDASFDAAISRFSAHHWRDVPAALAELRRVVKPGGRVLFVDVAGVDDPLYDTHIQAIELLRDASHVRDYRADEWLALFRNAGFDATVGARWRVPIEFASWVARMNTPAPRVAAIRSMWDAAPDEARRYFGVQADYSFELDGLLIDAY